MGDSCSIPESLLAYCITHCTSMLSSLHTITVASHSSSIKDLKKYEKVSVSTIFHHDDEIIIKTLIPG